VTTATSVRFTEEENAAIKTYAARNRRSVSEVIRQAILDRVEDEYDLRDLLAANKEIEQNPNHTWHSLSEVKAELGIQ